MNGEIANGERADDVDEDIEATDAAEDTVVLSEDLTDVDNVGDISVEINVEELVAKLEQTSSDDVNRRREIKKRLEELREQREAEAELDSTFNFNLDDDL